MKEAIGTSLVFNLMMIFVGVIIVILISSISYTKGFKIRNRIIDRIEEHNGYAADSTVSQAIEADLNAIGYKIVDKSMCKDRENAVKLTKDYNDYNYCVYEYSTSKGKYYGVTVFISFDVPLIGQYINIPIYGETRVIYDKGTVAN
jgi:hypothetical protein